MVLRTFIRQSYVTTHLRATQALTFEKYSAFSLCLDWEHRNTTISVAHIALALTVQVEVAEFIAKGIDSVWLESTVALSWRLLSHANCAPSKENASRVQCLSLGRGEIFLGIWENMVYPLLKGPENREWAEKWRGGHITNYVD